MAQEEKQLLLKDICTRLPYRPFAIWHHKALNKFRDVKIMKVSTYGKNIDDYYINVLCQPEPGEDYEASIVDIKPYLRPMSSMTEAERRTYTTLRAHALPFTIVAWLDENMFDHRTNSEGEHLIESGLALEAPDGMYNTKTK